VVAPLPPLKHFTGTTSEGTVVTFALTIEKHPRVTHFDFGSLSTDCGESVTVTTGREILPPYDEFTLPVRNNSFSGRYYAGYSVAIHGHFGTNGAVTGTVHWADADECETSTIAWTAQAAG
jgi:hypothetical protein